MSKRVISNILKVVSEQKKTPAVKAVKVKVPGVTVVKGKKSNAVSIKDVKSTNIKRYAYDESSRLLAIEFKNGRVYEYPTIAKQFYEGLNRSRSKGKYFEQWIRHGKCSEVKNSRLFKK